ncbi:DUF5666 domain-containing protein [Sulfitobacter sp. JB4-11]|uniref:DUF5666 domain-containing protein n=1 Tax=Sulfitobacter rhodophyticola TaxID=3238304 RepID=UPI003518DC9A
MKTAKFSRRDALGLGIGAAVFPGVAAAQTARPDVEGGIGGTGIVGLLTDFGSLIVAGNYVRTNDATRYSDGFGALQESDLRLGDSLTVEAAGAPDALVARRVHVTHPLVGAITQVAADRRRITVNGVEVRLDTRLQGLEVGYRVAVSGLWRGAFVQASRLAAARSASDLVAGDVARRGGRTQVGSVTVRGPGTGSVPRGSFASVVGQFDVASGILRARAVTNQRFTGAAGPLARLSVEGYLDPSSSAPGYRVAGLGHSFERNLKLDEFAGSRVLMNGEYNGKFAARGAVVLPEGFSAQRRLLRRISAQSR